MKNIEKAEKIHLGSLIEQLKKGNYVIPDFQRDFEWQPWDVLDLVKSIFMDYYIGTLLLWKGSRDNYSMLSCEPIDGFLGQQDPQHIVLDGQQRLTAIYYAFFQPDKAFPRRAKPVVYFMNIQAFMEEDYEKAFWYDSLTRKNADILANKKLQYEWHIFPLGVMKEGSWGTGDWIKAYRDFWVERVENENGDDETAIQRKKEYQKFADSAKVFKASIEELFNSYFVSYIELDREIDVYKVCDIFTQINSKGVSLDIFDLLNAILRPKGIHLKEMWKDKEAELRFIDPKKMKIYVLQVMSILEQSYCSSKYLYYLVPDATKNVKKPDGMQEQVVLIQSPDEFITRWNHSATAIKKAIQSLQNPRDFGAIKSNFIPYPSIIPVFAAIKAFVDTDSALNKLDIQAKIRKWYWASIFTNRYSSAMESTSAADFQALKKWFLNDDDEPEVISEFIGKYKGIDLKGDNPKGSAIYNAIFNLLVINEARDWASFDLPEYNSVDDHHIVPHSQFHAQGGAAVNSILNRTPLSEGTNRQIIRNRMPNEYLKEMLANNNPENVYEVLASHLISKKAVEILLRDPFLKSDFDEFLQERQETIKQGIEDMLIQEKIVVPVALKALNEQLEYVELGLRKILVSTLGNNAIDYKSGTPSHIQEKVDKRIEAEKRRKPGLAQDAFSDFSQRLVFFDLMEIFDTIANKANWQLFEPTFKNKEQLQNRFGQLAGLRNSIRHSRDVTDIERLDGEAAIAWFNQILKK